MQKTLSYVMMGGAALSCLIYIITTIIAVQCGASKKNDCAMKSGLVAVVFGCMVCSSAAFMLWPHKGGASGGL